MRQPWERDNKRLLKKLLGLDLERELFQQSRRLDHITDAFKLDIYLFDHRTIIIFLSPTRTR